MTFKFSYINSNNRRTNILWYKDILILIMIELHPKLYNKLNSVYVNNKKHDKNPWKYN